MALWKIWGTVITVCYGKITNLTLRSKFKVKGHQQWYATHRLKVVSLHAKYEKPILNDKKLQPGHDLLRTQGPIWPWGQNSRCCNTSIWHYGRFEGQWYVSIIFSLQSFSVISVLNKWYSLLATKTNQSIFYHKSPPHKYHNQLQMFIIIHQI
jgi:hypothetical protein